MKYNKKNPSADLRKKRPTLVLLGACAAMSMSLMAFEYRTYVSEPCIYDQDLPPIGLEDEIIPVSTTFVPPPPPPPKPKVDMALVIVDDDMKVPAEQEVILEELDPEDNVFIEIPEPVEQYIEPDEPFVIVEDMPEFPGGAAELFRFLSAHTVYPSIAKDAGIQGTVYVSFIVERDGTIGDVKVLRGIGGGCDEEAVRVIKKMPKWSPGRQRGKEVRVNYKVPYQFKLM